MSSWAWRSQSSATSSTDSPDAAQVRRQAAAGRSDASRSRSVDGPMDGDAASAIA